MGDENSKSEIEEAVKISESAVDTKIQESARSKIQVDLHRDSPIVVERLTNNDFKILKSSCVKLDSKILNYRIGLFLKKPPVWSDLFKFLSGRKLEGIETVCLTSSVILKSIKKFPPKFQTYQGIFEGVTKSLKICMIQFSQKQFLHLIISLSNCSVLDIDS